MSEVNNVEITCFVADRQMNSFMSAADLCPSYKVFVREEKLYFQTTTKVDGKYMMNLINVSKDGKDIWIAAIQWNRKMYVADGIKELSNGEEVIFDNGWVRG